MSTNDPDYRAALVDLLQQNPHMIVDVVMNSIGVKSLADHLKIASDIQAIEYATRYALWDIDARRHGGRGNKKMNDLLQRMQSNTALCRELSKRGDPYSEAFRRGL